MTDKKQKIIDILYTHRDDVRRTCMVYGVNLPDSDDHVRTYMKYCLYDVLECIKGDCTGTLKEVRKEIEALFDEDWRKVEELLKEEYEEELAELERQEKEYCDWESKEYDLNYIIEAKTSKGIDCTYEQAQLDKHIESDPDFPDPDRVEWLEKTIEKIEKNFKGE